MDCLKFGCLFLCLLLFLSLADRCIATTMYVAPSSEVPLRTGTERNKKIIAVLKDGTQVTLLQEEGAWAYVRTKGGHEGWILKRYLTKELPPKLLVAKLKEKNQLLQKKYQELKERLDNLSNNSSECNKKLASCISENQKLAAEYEDLKRDAANVIQTKQLLMETQKKLELANAERIKLKQRVNSLEANTNIKWFLAGGGVLFLGWLLGLISNRRKKRRPSLL